MFGEAMEVTVAKSFSPYSIDSNSAKLRNRLGAPAPGLFFLPLQGGSLCRDVCSYCGRSLWCNGAGCKSKLAVRSRLFGTRKRRFETLAPLKRGAKFR